MIKAGIKEARKRFSEYISMVQKGEEILITKRDEPIAKLIPVAKKKLRSLESHKGLRKGIKPKGKSLSEMVIESREESY